MAASFPHPDVDRFICFGVYSLNNAFGRLYGPHLEKIGLTYPQYLAMIVLWEKDGRTVGEIGARLALESNTLTPLLKRLEAAGLITRQRSQKDERQVLVVLTDKGKALSADAASIPSCIAEACGIALADLDTLRLTLSGLRSNIERAAASANDQSLG